MPGAVVCWKRSICCSASSAPTMNTRHTWPNNKCYCSRAERTWKAQPGLTIRKALKTRATDPRPWENDGRRDSLNKVIIFRKKIAGLSPPTLERFVLRARKAIRLRDIVNVLVTSSRELRSLNRRFRKIDKPTDVLSFPAPRAVQRQTRRVAGDVAISADIARENAIRMGHSVADEVKILA